MSHTNIALEYEIHYNKKDDEGNDNEFTKMIKFCKENGPRFGNELVRYEHVNIDVLFCFLNISMTSTATVKFKERMTYDKLSEAITIFDEAFAILIFENNFNRWVYMAEKHVNRIKKNETTSTNNSAEGSIEENENDELSHGTTEEDNSIEEDVPDVLYQVKVKQRKDKIDTAGKWKKEGMERLNELITKVQHGRNGEIREQFETVLQEKYVNYADNSIEEQNKNKRKREADEMSIVEKRVVVVKNVLNLIAL